MEKLKYEIESDRIAELLGVQNFTSKESAILELVKNAYDAGAKNLKIIFKNDLIIIIDDGCGMSYAEFKSNWTKIGKSQKGYDFIDENNEIRIFSGSMGIGRFALARLGNEIEVISKTKNDSGVRWKTDWIETTLEYDKCNEKGTRIEIRKLREKWLKSSVIKLQEYLSKTYNDDRMRITLDLNHEILEVKRLYIDPKLGYNCTSIINLEYNSKTTELACKIRMDEFLDEAKEYCENINLTSYTKIELMKNDIFDEIDIPEEEDIYNYLLDLGSFNAELYFSFRTNSIEKDKFLYKHDVLAEPYKSGVILYRNAFSINSYEGNKDWIGLGKRSRKSPAAATHPTGSWRVRENQLSGKVCIDKKINPYLEDLANRQGLNENLYYKLFIQIIDKGLKIFERYRQSIIRLINKKNKIENVEFKTKVVDTIIKTPSKINKLNEEETNELVSEIEGLKKEREKLNNENIFIEEKYKYDVRVLNSLSTQGLKASAIAHEMQTERDTISVSTEFIIKQLIELNMWDELNKNENTKYSHKNVPELLKKNESINRKILKFMDVMLANVEKEQFNARIINVNKCLTLIKNNWEIDYSWAKINLKLNGDINFFTTEDIINVIFDNLILNSIQQNDFSTNLNIKIEVDKIDNYLIFRYSDDGKGLHQKYLDDPKKILDVHESTRKNGHGLGMWIINNSLKMTGGDIIDIQGFDGFHIEFKLGDKI